VTVVVVGMLVGAVSSGGPAPTMTASQPVVQ